jgi:PilZ domain
MITAAATQRFSTHPYTPTGPDRRAKVRYSAAFTALCRLVDSSSAARCSASVRDVSITGIRLTLPEAIYVGARLLIELPLGGNRPRQVIHCRVRHAKPRPAGGWMVGCEFGSRLMDYEFRYLLKLRFMAWQHAIERPSAMIAR